MNERNTKREMLNRCGIPTWTITLTPLDPPGEAGRAPEIE